MAADLSPRLAAVLHALPLRPGMRDRSPLTIAALPRGGPPPLISTSPVVAERDNALV